MFRRGDRDSGLRGLMWGFGFSVSGWGSGFGTQDLKFGVSIFGFQVGQHKRVWGQTRKQGFGLTSDSSMMSKGCFFKKWKLLKTSF